MKQATMTESVTFRIVITAAYTNAVGPSKYSLRVLGIPGHVSVVYNACNI